MRVSILGIGVAMLLAAVPVRAEEPLVLTGTKLIRPYQPPQNCPPSVIPYVEPKVESKDGKVEPKVEPKVDFGQMDQFAGAGEAGTQPGAQFAPGMFGDLIGIQGNRIISRNGSTIVARGIPANGGYASGFKVTDNESPRPTNRIYFSYNLYDNVNLGSLGATGANVDFQRQVLGFERTFMNGDASFGMRLPFLQTNGFSGIDNNIVGDLSFLFKYAWINDRDTGNVVSTGLAITAPTGGGRDDVLADGSKAPRSVLFQPWGGWIYNLPNLYFQGFHSIVIPTDSRDPTILFNSVGAGYWLYRGAQDRIINGVVPAAELHINTPLTNRDSSNVGDLFISDQFNLTLGCHFLLPRLTFGGMACIPLAGPRPYDIEYMGTLNFRY